MIRRDYILRMIEEFLQLLGRLKSLKQEHRWEAVASHRQLNGGPQTHQCQDCSWPDETLAKR